MPSWTDFEDEAPELAARVRARLDAHTHKTIATIRTDGAPRISGTETQWREGELVIGSMWQARKALDLQRDPRYALHSGSDDPPGWVGDAKIAGVAVELPSEEFQGQPAHFFRLDVREVSHVGMNATGDGIVVEIWKPGAPVRRIDRK